MHTFAPNRQVDYCAYPGRCVTGRAPTLADVSAAYGKGAAQAWLVTQLYDLGEFCGCREKFSERQMEDLTYLVAHEYHWLKVTELMLFLKRFKSGRYGKFYGAVDPLAIMEALRHYVLHERGEIVAEHDRAVREERENADRRKSVSYEQYRQIRDGQRDNDRSGDKAAQIPCQAPGCGVRSDAGHAAGNAEQGVQRIPDSHPSGTAENHGENQTMGGTGR